MFVTKNGERVDRVRSDGLHQWWQRLREAIGDSKDMLAGFYTFRRLGTTESGPEKVARPS